MMLAVASANKSMSTCGVPFSRKLPLMVAEGALACLQIRVLLCLHTRQLLHSVLRVAFHEALTPATLTHHPRVCQTFTTFRGS